MSRIPDSLPPGTRIDHYVIEETLSRGGFSVVYLAQVTGFDKQVAIKEYLPKKLARRDADMNVVPNSEDDRDQFNHGRRLFFNEAGILSSLKHPNIVKVFNFFRANGTVYMVMEYQPGENLQYYIRKHETLSEEFIRTVFPPFLSALKYIHRAKLLHLDIKPSNVHLLPGGVPLMLDFGTVYKPNFSRRASHGKVITPGYSPIELYDMKGYVGPWSDIYATGATIRSCMEGRPPPPADERNKHDEMRPAVEAFRKKYALPLLRAVDWAMELNPLNRPQNVDQLLDALFREEAVPEKSRFNISSLIKPITGREEDKS